MVIGTLQVFDIYVYALVDPSILFVNLYIVLDFSFSLEILLKSLSFSTLVGVLVIARQVYRNWTITVS